MRNKFRLNTYFNRVIAAEVSSLTRYADSLVQWKPTRDDQGRLLKFIECKNKQFVTETDDFPNLKSDKLQNSAVLLNGSLNYSEDIQGILSELRKKLTRSSRVIVVAYNSYYRFIYRLIGKTPPMFFTLDDLRNIFKLTGYEILQIRLALYCPWRFLGIGSLINYVLPVLPFFKWFGFTAIIVLRAHTGPQEQSRNPSLSVIIPARNERDSIENAIRTMPDFDAQLEIIFVEGNSNDGTWEEIERVKKKYSSTHDIRAFKQKGRGKDDAVRFGFEHATKDLLTILDADLTMPAAMLKRYYDAYCDNKADFINGNRLMYPMENGAMRFMNHLGNVFFAKALSWVLGMRISDTLCGTKMFSKRNYERMLAWQADFGRLDPFGDFNFLFAAAVLCLGIVDVPLSYKSRIYGTTNISRFRDGARLFIMTATGLFRIKAGKLP